MTLLRSPSALAKPPLGTVICTECTRSQGVTKNVCVCVSVPPSDLEPGSVWRLIEHSTKPGPTSTQRLIIKVYDSPAPAVIGSAFIWCLHSLSHLEGNRSPSGAHETHLHTLMQTHTRLWKQIKRACTTCLTFIGGIVSSVQFKLNRYGTVWKWLAIGEEALWLYFVK